MAIDMWSLGCILAELLTGFPLLPGEDEPDQLACIIEMLGMPPQRLLDKAKRARQFISTKGYPRYSGVSFNADGSLDLSGGLSRRGKFRGPPGSKKLKKALKGCEDPLFLDFIERCLEWDPELRMTPSRALRHAWLRRRLPRPPDPHQTSSGATSSTTSLANGSSVNSSTGAAVAQPSPVRVYQATTASSASVVKKQQQDQLSPAASEKMLAAKLELSNLPSLATQPAYQAGAALVPPGIVQGSGTMSLRTCPSGRDPSKHIACSCHHQHQQSQQYPKEWNQCINGDHRQCTEQLRKELRKLIADIPSLSVSHKINNINNAQQQHNDRRQLYTQFNVSETRDKLRAYPDKANSQCNSKALWDSLSLQDVKLHSNSSSHNSHSSHGSLSNVVSDRSLVDKDVWQGIRRYAAEM
ncbi:hypothetical protein QAD02_014682 [Eretmocerus hayati]|uniref:Uncharacterized protein n=1 Tax=Eretmocerus hayati TaxID=131215 RepID=A0ACC2P5P1_9HYME|nr:hypothetical protein QAD02_014682 [Eretmocerus hayati]